MTEVTPRTLPTQPSPPEAAVEEERYRRFEELQRAMPTAWDSMRQDLPDESVVVVPSVSLEQTTASSGTLMQAMEERSLFLLLLLRQPRLHLVYVTSMPVSEQIVEYYLGLLPGVIPSHARARLTLLSVGDASPTPLSAKLLARPRLLQRIRELVANPLRSHLVPYNTTPLERDVALALGIPMYGADPRLASLGTKTGCRRLFEELDVPCAAGAEGLATVADVVAAVVGIRGRRPGLAAVIVKLDEGVSGSGNATVDLRGLPPHGAEGEAEAVHERVLALRPEAPGLSATEFLGQLESLGGVAEERLDGVAVTSPSVQMRALPDGNVELLSTHDQLLGGASGQQYLGCVFPADPAYARLISGPAMVIGRHLAERGVLGRFAVDFVVVRDAQGGWAPYVIELNLRKGGTTHPFLTLQFLTDGTYDGSAGTFLTPAGAPKHLVATDHFEDDRLRALTVPDLFDAVATRALHFDQARQTGVVLHLISCLTECGRLGLTAVGDTHAEAWATFQRAQAVILEEAVRAGGR